MLICFDELWYRYKYSAGRSSSVRGKTFTGVLVTERTSSWVLCDVDGFEMSVLNHDVDDIVTKGASTIRS